MNVEMFCSKPLNSKLDTPNYTHKLWCVNNLSWKYIHILITRSTPKCTRWFSFFNFSEKVTIGVLCWILVENNTALQTVLLNLSRSLVRLGVVTDGNLWFQKLPGADKVAYLAVTLLSPPFRSRNSFVIWSKLFIILINRIQRYLQFRKMIYDNDWPLTFKTAIPFEGNHLWTTIRFFRVQTVMTIKSLLTAQAMCSHLHTVQVQFDSF